ncbi:MAG: glycosyltransferase family 39 protein [Candidatus Levyibacteriota bacterium]
MKKNFIFLFLIIFLAFALRTYQLGNVPPSTSLDEASIGWNAFSILTTGGDEYGYKFPILLRAFDDWRPATYVYMVIPFIKLLGLSVLSVRLPSVILSVLTVLATYFLVNEMFRKQKLLRSEYIALACAFLLAISPWHIYISRLGHEVNLAFSAFVFAMYFFLRKNIYLAALFFVISFISYQTEKLFIPAVIFGLAVVFYKDLLKQKKQILIAAVFSLIILVPFIRETLSPNALIRFSATNVFELNKSRYTDQFSILQSAILQNDKISEVLYNRRLVTSQIFAESYLSHFNPVWLFTNSSGDRHKVPGVGLMYIWELPLIMLGIYFLLRLDFDKKIKVLIFVWFLSAPIAASLTTDSPHALRTLVFLPTWQIFSGLGLVYMFSLVHKKIRRNVLLASGLVIVFASLWTFSRQYFYVFPKTQSDSFQYSLSQAIGYVQENEKNYKSVIFANNDNLAQSYMFFLFYTKYDPKLYQEQGGTVSGGYNVTHEFGKYEFRPVSIEEEKSRNLIIGNYSQFFQEEKLAPEIETIKDIENLNGEKTIKIFTIKK